MTKSENEMVSIYDPFKVVKNQGVTPKRIMYNTNAT